MCPLTIADEKSFRPTFPLDSFMNLIGLLPRNLFNIAHICFSANLPKAIYRIFSRLHPELLRLLAPLGPWTWVLSMPARGAEEFRNTR
jgi:hypothetical protein